MDKCIIGLVEGISYLTFAVAFCVLGVLGNAVVCATISLTPSLQKSYNFLITNLAVTDLLTLLIVEPLIWTIIVKSMNGNCSTTEELVRVTRALAYFLCCASLLTITAMSLDRCFAVLIPFRYKNFATPQTVRRGAVLIWHLSIGAGTLEGSKVIPIKICSLTTQVVISILYSVIMTCYISIFIKIKKQTKIRARLQCSNQDHSRKREKNLAKTIALVAGIFTVCWAPIFYSMSVKPNQAFEEHLFRWATLLGVANSAVNPVVYFYSNKDFRKAAKKTCCRTKTQYATPQPIPKPVVVNRAHMVRHT